MLKSKYLSILMLCGLLYYVVSCINRTTGETRSAFANAPAVMKHKENQENFPSQRKKWTSLKKQYEQLAVDQLEKGTQYEQVAIHSISYTLQEVDAALLEHEKSKDAKPSALHNADTNLDLARELVESLVAGKDPFLNRSGDMRLAYRSEVDGSLQPFRLYVPEKLDLAKTQPMIVALHGRSGDENTFLDVFRDRRDGASLFKRLGDEYGFILVSPRGGGPGSGYRDAAAQDVLDVTALIPQLYPIREDAVFLTGHSMGGGGVMLIGLNHPEHYRALAPIAGGLWVASGIRNMNDKAKNMPVRFYQGTADKIVPVDQRALSSTKSILTDFKLIEFRGADHSSIFYKALPEVFEFFGEYL